MEIFMNITAADGYKTISADLARDPIVSAADPATRLQV